jgi:arylsulfatase A-like enzyme
MDRAFGKLREAIHSLPSYENTVLWYCSDNGGLAQLGATGGRGHKGHVYDGGLRVPAILEWPAGIKEARNTSIPANTSDIFPTLLDMAGIPMADDRPMDGISLLPVIDQKMEHREKPMGFWHYPAGGVRTPSIAWMAELLEAQKKGDMIGDSLKLRLDDILIPDRYPIDTLAGHAAWLDWPWKLHRIQDKEGRITWELYHLENDSMETANRYTTEAEKALEMKAGLESWQQSVVQSMYGFDYEK